MNRIFIVAWVLLMSEMILSQKYQDFRILEDSLKIYVKSDRAGNAKQILKKLSQVNENHDIDSLTMRLNDNYAYFHYMQGDFDKSADFLNRAAAIALRKKYTKNYLDYRNNLGAIFTKLSEYTKAREVYWEVINLSDSTLIDEDYLATLLNLGSATQSLGQFYEANHIFERGISIANELNLPNLTAPGLKFLAKNQLELGDFEKMIETARILQDDYWEYLPQRQQADLFFYRAQAYYELDNLKSAENDMLQLLSLMESQPKDPSIIERLEFYVALKKSRGNYLEALNLSQKVAVLKDSLDLATMTAKTLEIEEKYQVAQRERENLMLKREAAEKDLMIAEKNLHLLYALLVLGITILAFIFYQLKKSNKKNLELKKVISERTKLESELSTVRDTIARDFHDDLGNRLARVSIFSNLLKQELGASSELELVDQIKSDADYLFKGTRDFIFSLNSESNYLENLTTYLSDFGEDYLKEFGVGFIVNKEIKNFIELPHYWSKQLIFIFKEAITNAVKHSRCTEIILSFYSNTEHLRIVLSDNGTGLPEENKPGCGLKNMYRRTEEIGGTLNIYASLKKGTTVKFEGSLK